VFDRLPFRHIVAADFEFEFGGHKSFEEASRSGERPRPVCAVLKDLRTAQVWEWRRGEPWMPPFPIDCLVAYYASAELGCFKALNLPTPLYVLDLFTEFRARTNGRNTPNGASLLGALTYFGLDGMDATEKQDLRLKILSGGPWSAEDMNAFVDYCGKDTSACGDQLLPAMLPQIDFQRALLRGRFMKAAAAVEWNGPPIDTTTLQLLRRYWTDIQDDLIAAIDKDYGVFEGRTFKIERWERWLAVHGFPGHGSPAAVSISATIRFDRWRARIRPLRQCASFVVRSLKCGSPTWPSAVTDAIERSSQRSVRGQDAALRVTLVTSLGRACGCGA
jgi:hypothetical protein